MSFYLFIFRFVFCITKEILKKAKSLERGFPQVLFSPNSSPNINNANERLEPKRSGPESRRSVRAGSRLEEGAGLCQGDGLHRIFQPNMSSEQQDEGGWRQR